MAKRSNTMPLFFILMGTLAFSLSTLPSPETTGHFTVTSLSSEFASDCDSMGQSIGRGANSGSCRIDAVETKGDSKVVGRIDVKLVDVGRRNPKDFNKIETRKEWQRTTEIICEGKNCPRDSIKITTNYDQDEYNKLARMDDFESGARKMVNLMKTAEKEAKKERAEQDKRYYCEVDSDGRKFRNEREEMRCKFRRLDKLDVEEAAEYYQDHILPTVQGLVSSNDPSKQRAGMELLRQINAANVGGDFVKESVTDLARFGQFRYQANQQKTQLLLMDRNDPRAAQLAQNIQLAQFRANAYFGSRGLKVEGDEWGVGANGFDYSDMLVNNLKNFQAKIDTQYQQMLVEYQRRFPNPAQFSNQVLNNSAPQMANAWPQGGAQDPNMPPVPGNSPQQQQQWQQWQQQQQANTTPPAYTTQQKTGSTATPQQPAATTVTKTVSRRPQKR